MDRRSHSCIIMYLCIWSLLIYGLIVHSKPENTILGIGISAAAVLIMPYLAIVKRRVSSRIHSEALAGDAVKSITCAYMAGTVLIGLVLNTLFGWWWVEISRRALVSRLACA